MINAQSDMEEIISALRRADDLGCQEFVRRQPMQSREELAEAMPRLADAAYAVMLERQSELMEFKYPSEPEPLPADTMQSALNDAVSGQAGEDIQAQLRGLGFGELATLRSLVRMLEHHAARSMPRTPTSN